MKKKAIFWAHFKTSSTEHSRIKMVFGRKNCSLIIFMKWIESEKNKIGGDDAIVVNMGIIK